LFGSVALVALLVNFEASAAASIEDVLARLERIEKENTALRERVRQLESSRSQTTPARSAAPVQAPANVAPGAHTNPGAMAMAAPVPVRPVRADWTGLYLGGGAGWQQGVLRGSDFFRGEGHTTSPFSGGLGFLFFPEPQVNAVPSDERVRGAVF